MKLSRKKFVLLFLVSGFAFVFIYNVVILGVVRGRPESGAAFLGTDSLTGWRWAVATILYPIKIVLIGPVLPLINLPDPPPPMVGIGVAIYWTMLALVIYYILGKIRGRRTS